MISITKRRLASLATASAMVATMAVAVHARGGLCGRAGPRPGSSETATTSPQRRQSTGPSPATINAAGYDIAVYFGPGHSGTVRPPTSPVRSTTASSPTAATRQRDRQQGPRHRRQPVQRRLQRGRAIIYINGASGTISGNQVYDFQKNGIEVIGLAADGALPPAPRPPRRSRRTSSPARVPSTTSPRTAS